MRLFGWMIILLFPLCLFAQKLPCSCGVRSIATVGMIAGESGVRPLFQLNGGITYGRYFSGVGIGFDPYRFNSMPLFADGRIHLGKSKAAFIYGNAGYNLPVGGKYTDENFKTSDVMRGGLYIDAGLGYRIPLGPRHGLSLSAGFSQKNITRTKGYVYPCGLPECAEEFYRYSYRLGRVVTQLSWELDWKKK